MLELELSPSDHHPQLIGYAHLKHKKRRYHSFASKTKVSFSIEDLSGCRLNRDGYQDSVWIGGTCFDLDARDADKAQEFLASLGIKIQDKRKPGEVK